MAELLQKTLSLLARREHSQAELKHKLKSTATEEEIAQLLEKLAAEGLQSDSRFVESFIRSRIQLGAGPRRIDQELRQRGVGSALIEALLPNDEDYWMTHLQAVWQKKYHGSLPKNRNEMARQLRFLQSRGFASGMIIQLLRINSSS